MIKDGYIEIETELQQLITAEQAWHYEIIPSASSEQELSFYISEENVSETIADELEMLFGKSIVFTKVGDSILKKSLGKYYRQKQTKGSNQTREFSSRSDDFLMNIIEEANEVGSSDIHIETYEERCRVRMRIDGKLAERYVLDKTTYPSIINKIK
jgi:type IV pilus assembly protein PilB